VVSAICFHNIRTYDLFLGNVSPVLPQAVRWLRRLNTDFSFKDLWFSPGWIQLILLAAELTMAQIFLRESSVFRALIIAPLLRTRHCATSLTRQHTIILSFCNLLVADLTDIWLATVKKHLPQAFKC